MEYLLGQYCSSNEDLIDEGVQIVKDILANNYVRPDESEKILSKIREQGFYSVIDVISVKFNYKYDYYQTSFSNLGLKNVAIDPSYPKQYERLLGGNLWCMVKLEFDASSPDIVDPFRIAELVPIQMANFDLDEILNNKDIFQKMNGLI